MRKVYKLKSKYARALYAAIKQREGDKRQRARMQEKFTVAEFREILGVPKGKLTTFSNLNTIAIKPAVLKINALEDLGVKVEGLKYGGKKVLDIRMHWYKKDVVGMEWIVSSSKEAVLKLLVKQRNYNRQVYRDKRKSILDTLGNRCVCCGETEEIYLEIDHVFNDGSKDKAPSLKKIKENKERYQILCCNCNRAKHKNGGELFFPDRKKTK